MKSEIKKAEEQFNLETGVQIFITDREESKGITGLLANKLKSQWEQPVLVMWLNEETNEYIGSMRGYEKTMSDFQTWCINTGKFNFVQGHPNAAGISMNAEKLNEFIECCKNIESKEIIYKVDMVYDDSANVEHIFQVCDNRKIFGNGIEEPLFAIKNLKAPESSLNWSKKTMRIRKNFITYVFFGVEEEKFNEIKEKAKIKDVNFELIGKFEVNEWNSKKYPQFIVVDWEIKKIINNNPKDLGTFMAMSTPTNYGIFA